MANRKKNKKLGGVPELAKDLGEALTTALLGLTALYPGDARPPEIVLSYLGGSMYYSAFVRYVHGQSIVLSVSCTSTLASSLAVTAAKFGRSTAVAGELTGATSV